MRKELANKARLQHVLEAIGEIEKYTSGFSVETFLADSKTHFATIKQLEIIGEAANHLSSDLLAEFDENRMEEHPKFSKHSGSRIF